MSVSPISPENIAATLTAMAAKIPFERAVVCPAGRDGAGRPCTTQWTFRELDQESDRLARGLVAMGVTPGMRLVLMVRPGLEFIALTYALFKAGAVVVLIDPGMGARHIFRCLDQVEPQGFVAISPVHWVRRLNGSRFSAARFNVLVGRSRGWWPAGWSIPTYDEIRGDKWSPWQGPPIRSRDPAAIIFTSGSTGPAKGVLYEHGMFAAQVQQIRDFYRIHPGGRDLPGFPLFALFNAAMGVTTVVPRMNPSRPAQVDPVQFVETIHNQGITQAFGSPAIWSRIGRWCEQTGTTVPSLTRILSAGAPVPETVLKQMTAAMSGGSNSDVTGSDENICGEMHTPYGATEALPVASISARELLLETAEKTRRGAGTCVGTTFPGIEVRVIARTAGPIADWSDVRILPAGEIGEIVVSGPVVTREYFRRPDATARAKIPDRSRVDQPDRFWHRMGDVGYFDTSGRLWFCGRQSQTVETPAGPRFTDQIEPVFNTHPRVFRSALVGVGPAGQQRPVVIIEPERNAMPKSTSARQQFVRELCEIGENCETTRGIVEFLFHPSLPVDVRHNAKISREKLAIWAARKMNR